LHSEFSKKVREFIEKIPKSSPEKKSVKAIENEIKKSLEKLKKLYTVDDKERGPSPEKDLVMKDISLDETEMKFENIEEIIYNIWYRMVREEK
jgi:acetolactate synthase small subunit